MSRRIQLEELLAEDPDDTFLQYGVAMEYRAEGNLEMAEARFQALVQSKPEYVPAYFRLGELYAEMERVDDARQILSRGIEVAEKTGDHHAAGEMAGFRASLVGGL